MKIALLYKLHKYLGLLVAVFLIWLSVSGILLNHTEALKLDEKHIQSEWVHSLYGLKKAQLGPAFKLNNDWVFQFGSALILNRQTLITTIKPILAALHTEDLFIIANSEQILLFSKAGELVDTLKTPAPLNNMAWFSINGTNHAKRLLIQTTKGLYLANENITDWISSSLDKEDLSKGYIHWSHANELPSKQRQQLLQKHQQYAGKGPNLEQLILDTHSGRIMGKWGVYFMDVIALITLLLTMLGVYLYLQRLNN